MNEVEVTDFLEHHGIKGMKWGLRRDPAKRLARKDANSAVLGYGLRGWAAGKVNKRYIRKNKLEKFETKDYNKLSPALQKKYDAKIKRRVYSSMVGRTAVEAALVGGLGHVTANKLNLDPRSKELVKYGASSAAGLIGVIGGLQVKAIHDSYVIDKLRKEVHGN